MKKYFSYILMGVTVLFTGCEQFFSNNSPSSTDSQIFASAEQTEQLIAGIYAILPEQNSYRTRLGGPWVMPGTDIEFYAPSSSSATPDYAVYSMTAAGHTDLNVKDKNPWTYLTVGIERANVAINGIENNADTTNVSIRYLYGEALTLRAWLTYEMTKLWGDIPYIFSAIDGSYESIYP